MLSLLGDRLAAGRQTLDLSTEVRILVPQPNDFKGLAGRLPLSFFKKVFGGSLCTSLLVENLESVHGLALAIADRMEIDLRSHAVFIAEYPFNSSDTIFRTVKYGRPKMT